MEVESLSGVDCTFDRHFTLVEHLRLKPLLVGSAACPAARVASEVQGCVLDFAQFLPSEQDKASATHESQRGEGMSSIFVEATCLQGGGRSSKAQEDERKRKEQEAEKKRKAEEEEKKRKEQERKLEEERQAKLAAEQKRAQDEKEEKEKQEKLARVCPLRKDRSLIDKIRRKSMRTRKR